MAVVEIASNREAVTNIHGRKAAVVISKTTTLPTRGMDLFVAQKSPC